MIFALKFLLGWFLISAIVTIQWSKWRTAEKRREADQALAWLKEIEHR